MRKISSNFLAVLISVFISTSVIFLSKPAFAASGSAGGKPVEYADGATKLKGYYVAAEKSKGAILIIPEWWGINDYARSRADQLGKLGYSTLAADMYGDGYSTTDAAKAKEWSGPFYSDSSLMTRRVQVAFDTLASESGVDKNRIVVIGYCFGGTSALQFALSGGAAAGVAAFHGGLKLAAPANPSAVKAKFIVMEGEDDPMVPPEDRASFRKILKDGKYDFTWIDYSGAVHAFTNPKASSFGIPGVAYSPSADQQSFGHLQLFLYRVFNPKDKK